MEIGEPKKSDETMIMLDSGSFAHVCPPWLREAVPADAHEGEVLGVDSGRPTHHQLRREVRRVHPTFRTAREGAVPCHEGAATDLE
eukprot:11167462-Heterocapsa_arctica.AAC.2